jgi:UDP-4-amino-4-deoxy-L-arabinose formyltransferase/UDP-glucuronic acid dehydrogenase (UDP-4-keto-hexauronic acid decarboxylating)
VKLRVVLVGQEAAGAQILRALADSDHQMVAVLSDAPVSRGGPASLVGLARALGVQALPAARVSDPGFATQLRDWSVDVLLNAHSLHLVADAVLAAPAIGSFNLHPGPLPEYAGLNTPAWGIYNGESHFGVTVHWMVPIVDAGPIAFQERFPIDEGATALTLSAECTRRGVGLVARVLELAGQGRSIPAVPQDLSRRAYHPRARIPQGGRVDCSRSAAEVARFGRAFDYGPFVSPWGRAFLELGSGRLEVGGLTATGEASSEPAGTLRLSTEGRLELACADEWLSIRRLYVHGSAVEPSLWYQAFRSGTPAAKSSLE